MKIYCSCCDKVQPVHIDNCRDAKTHEPFQDIVCATCDLVIASGTDIAQPEQEPVAWLIWLHGPAGHFDHKQFAEMEFERRNKEYPDPDRKLLPLYITPPQRKPLTDEDMKKIWYAMQNIMGWYSFQEIARAIEAAHGIKE